MLGLIYCLYVTSFCAILLFGIYFILENKISNKKNIMLMVASLLWLAIFPYGLFDGYRIVDKFIPPSQEPKSMISSSNYDRNIKVLMIAEATNKNVYFNVERISSLFTTGEIGNKNTLIVKIKFNDIKEKLFNYKLSSFFANKSYHGLIHCLINYEREPRKGESWGETNNRIAYNKSICSYAPYDKMYYGARKFKIEDMDDNMLNSVISKISHQDIENYKANWFKQKSLEKQHQLQRVAQRKQQQKASYDKEKQSILERVKKFKEKVDSSSIKGGKK